MQNPQGCEQFSPNLPSVHPVMKMLVLFLQCGRVILISQKLTCVYDMHFFLNFIAFFLSLKLISILFCVFNRSLLAMARREKQN